MLLIGLGFVIRSFSLTPPFFSNKPLDFLFREGICAEMFHRFQLGRRLEEVHAYGCDRLLSEIAVAVCAQEGIDLRFKPLDTTSFALTGEYVPHSDEQAMTITHGHSQDSPPGLEQAAFAPR